MADEVIAAGPEAVGQYYYDDFVKLREEGGASADNAADLAVFLGSDASNGITGRMLHAVPRATVVVTNPTHFAVALEYRREKSAAPVVIAKGRDLVAARIREIAREHSVPIVENPPLARALFKECELGDTIPGPLFGAVAEVLAYLIRIKQLVL